MDTIVRVSGKLTVGNCVNLAKRRLQSSAEAELHAVGYSILTALKAAARLQELGYISSSSFSTESLSESDRQLSKVVVRLTKSPDFDRIHEEFVKSQQAT